ncbi:hypothetical protein VDGL01_06090 [Verticillium dahliae]
MRQYCLLAVSPLQPFLPSSDPCPFQCHLAPRPEGGCDLVPSRSRPSRINRAPCNLAPREQCRGRDTQGAIDHENGPASSSMMMSAGPDSRGPGMEGRFEEINMQRKKLTWSAIANRVLLRESCGGPCPLLALRTEGGRRARGGKPPSLFLPSASARNNLNCRNCTARSRFAVHLKVFIF